MRLIDSDALKRYIPTRMDMQDLYLPVHFKTLIDEQPTVDAVPVVRCKDCKHRDPADHGCDCAGHEMLMGGIIPMPDNWFCADGERR